MGPGKSGLCSEVVTIQRESLSKQIFWLKVALKAKALVYYRVTRFWLKFQLSFKKFIFNKYSSTYKFKKRCQNRLKLSLKTVFFHFDQIYMAAGQSWQAAVFQR